MADGPSADGAAPQPDGAGAAAALELRPDCFAAPVPPGAVVELLGATGVERRGVAGVRGDGDGATLLLDGGGSVARRDAALLSVRLEEFHAAPRPPPAPPAQRAARSAAIIRLLGAQRTKELLTRHRGGGGSAGCAALNPRAAGVVVRASAVPGAGRGVWWDGPGDLPRGEVVTQYAGARIPPDEAAGGRGLGDYGVTLPDSRGGVVAFVGDWTCADPAAGVAQLINDAASVLGPTASDAERQRDAYLEGVAAGACNVGFELRGGGGGPHCVAVALRPIPAGSELLAAYGLRFWLGRAQALGIIAQDSALLWAARRMLGEPLLPPGAGAP